MEIKSIANTSHITKYLGINVKKEIRKPTEHYKEI